MPMPTIAAHSATSRHRRQSLAWMKSSQAATPKAVRPTSGWAPMPSPNARAAATSHRSARREPERCAAAQTMSSQTTSATNTTFRACTSARVAFSHGSAANAKARPATPAEPARRNRFDSSMRWPAISTTRPAAMATQMPERRFMRHATSPNGSWLQSQPIIAYTGKPVGWKIDRVAGTVCASPVSQKKVDGSIVRR